MIGICYRYVSNRQIAEDLAHDAFLCAMNKSDTFKGKGQFDAWLRKITVNTALQHLRDIKVQNKNQQSLKLSDSLTHDEEMNRSPDFTIQELLNAINKLPEHHKLVFNLYVIDNCSHKQIAHKLDINIGTSKSHLARARKKLQLILSEKQYEKKTGKSFMFLLFPFGYGRINRLYKNKFSNFELELINTRDLKDLNWNDIKQPDFGAFSNYSNSIITATIVGLAVIFIGMMVFIKRNNHGNQKEDKTIVFVDTLLSLKNTDSIPKSTDSASESKGPQKPSQVIVKKKRIILKKVVVRDTLTIYDTINER